jgi:hypothetical protein
MTQLVIGPYTLRRIESNLVHEGPDYRPVARIQIVHKNGEGADFPEEWIESAIRHIVDGFF